MFDEAWNLSSRQKDVLFYIGEGCTNNQIADKLVITKRTVESHLVSIYTKLNVKNRLEASVVYLNYRKKSNLNLNLNVNLGDCENTYDKILADLLSYRVKSNHDLSSCSAEDHLARCVYTLKNNASKEFLESLESDCLEELDNLFNLHKAYVDFLN